MNSVIIYGITVGWKRLVRAKGTRQSQFEFFANHCSSLGYHLMCLDDPDSIDGWGYTPPPYDEIETVEI